MGMLRTVAGCTEPSCGVPAINFGNWSQSKQAMIDDAYNRHAFTDDILPEWFVDHEKKYRTGPIKEVCKASLSDAPSNLCLVAMSKD